MNNMFLYIIICAFFIYFVIRITTDKRTELVDCVFAGEFNKVKFVKVPKYRNRTIYTEGEKIIDLSGYKRFIISGHSLEKEGFADGNYIYMKYEFQEEPINSFFDHFVVLFIDRERIREERKYRKNYFIERISLENERNRRKNVMIRREKEKILMERLENKDDFDSRTYEKVINMDYLDEDRLYKEQPECEIPDRALIIRKVITKLPTVLNPDIVKERFLKDILEIDDEKHENVDPYDIYIKYKFASEYYKNEEYLIVAMTYKNGYKDYSFHSVYSLRGVVKYKSVN